MDKYRWRIAGQCTVLRRHDRRRAAWAHPGRFPSRRSRDHAFRHREWVALHPALATNEGANQPQPELQRLRERAKKSRTLVTDLETWLRGERAKLSAKSETARAIDYSLKRWAALTRFLDDGRLCVSNNAAERALRGIAVGRHNWTFAGSDEGGRRAAAIYTLIETAKLNSIDPQAWLADVLARLPDYPAKRIADLMPWNWRPHSLVAVAA